MLTRLAAIADLDLIECYTDDGNLRNLRDIPEPVRRLLAGLETDEIFAGSGKDRERIGYSRKVKIPDRLKGLELIGRHLKMFTDRIELGGQVDLREEILKGRERARKGATG